LSADPSTAKAFADPGQWNKYSYAGNDPVNFYDPLGLQQLYPENNPFPGGDPRTGSGGGGGCGILMNVPPDPESGSSGGVECILNNPSGSSPTAGGPTPAPPKDFLPRDNARSDLQKTKCYQLLHFNTAAAAQSWLDGLQFNYNSYGRLVVNNGVPQATPAAASTLGYHTAPININTDYNWNNLSSVTTSTGGTFNFLGYINQQLGTSMKSDQLGALIVLHELRHDQGDEGEGVAFNKDIHNDCIK